VLTSSPPLGRKRASGKKQPKSPINEPRGDRTPLSSIKDPRGRRASGKDQDRSASRENDLIENLAGIVGSGEF